MNNGQVTFMGLVNQTYQGSGSGGVFEVLAQSATSPCFPQWKLRTPYVLVIPWHPSLQADTGALTLSDPQPIDKSEPSDRKVGCFYINLDGHSYYKAVADLDPAEVKLLAQHAPKK
jgi:hypothetical protein